MAAEEYGTFGWHGISFEVPADWELGKESGTRKEGYIRLDDEYLPRVEMTWRKPNKRYNLNTIFNNYIRKLRKRVGDKNLEIHELKNFCDPLTNKEYVVFKWNNKTCPVYEIVSFCRDCYRLVFMRYITEEETNAIERAKRLFSSFEDHSLDGKERWRFLDLDFTIPGNFSLEDAVLNAGFIRVDFADREEGISVMMISLGKELLEKRPFEDLVSFYLQTDIRKYKKLDFKERTINDHKGVFALPIYQKHSKFLKPLFPVKGFIEVYAWFCKEKNKIFIFKGSSLNKKSLEETANEYRSIKCH